MKQVGLDTEILKKADYFLNKCEYVREISNYYLLGEEVQVVLKDREIHLNYYDNKINQTWEFKETEVLLLIDMIINHKHVPITVNQKADIVMYIVCKKFKLFCISELKNPYMHNLVKEYLKKLKQQEISDYVCEYLRT